MPIRFGRPPWIILIAVVLALVGWGVWAVGVGARPKGKDPRPPNINNCRKKSGPHSCVPRAPGSRGLGLAKVKPHKSGKFPHFNSPKGEEGANEDVSWRPPGKLPRGKLAPTDKSSSVARRLRAGIASATFSTNTSLQNTVDFCRNGGCSLPPDSSGADSGKIVLATGNWKSFGAVSSNAGATFRLLDPTTIFPSGPSFTTSGGTRVQLDSGMCCDQVVQYVPKINRFIWLMQFGGACGGTCGTNKLRIAAATPSVVAGGHVDLLGSDFRHVRPAQLDSEHGLSGSGRRNQRLVRERRQRRSWPTCHAYSPEPDRLELDDRHRLHDAVGLRLGVRRALDQNVGDTAYWAGHVDNRTMRIFSMTDSENVYRWRDVGINSWCNGDRSSKVPGGTDWLAFGFPGNAVLGSTLRSSRGELWFAWGAGHAMAAGTSGTCRFPQSHIQIEVLRASDFHPIGQMQVWNKSIAFAYPSLATNPKGDVAMSLGYGGGGGDAAHAVGFWGDFVVFTTTAGDDSINRFGDYVTVRRSWPNTNDFSAEGYSTKAATATNNCPNNGTFAAGFGSGSNFCFDPHYVRFRHS